MRSAPRAVCVIIVRTSAAGVLYVVPASYGSTDDFHPGSSYASGKRNLRCFKLGDLQGRSTLSRATGTAGFQATSPLAPPAPAEGVGGGFAFEPLVRNGRTAPTKVAAVNGAPH